MKFNAGQRLCEKQRIALLENIKGILTLLKRKTMDQPVQKANASRSVLFQSSLLQAQSRPSDRASKQSLEDFKN